jgi:FtsZ-binding cell division protein ZapB
MQTDDEDRKTLDTTAGRVEYVFQQRLNDISGIKYCFFVLPLKRRYSNNELRLEMRVHQDIRTQQLLKIGIPELFEKARRQLQQIFACKAELIYEETTKKDLDMEMRKKKAKYPPFAKSAENEKDRVDAGMKFARKVQPSFSMTSTITPKPVAKLAPPQSFAEVKTRSRIFVIKYEGDSITINCVNELYRTGLTDDNAVQLPSKLIRSDKRFIIKQLASQDNGIYTCWSKDYIMSISLMVLKDKPVSAKVVSDVKRQLIIRGTNYARTGFAEVALNSRVTLICEETPNDANNAGKWTRLDGKRITSLVGRSIRIDHMRASDAGIYICRSQDGQLAQGVDLRIRKYYNNLYNRV